MKKATIYKIAREAGVSVTTVSRFFNNYTILDKLTFVKLLVTYVKYLGREEIALAYRPAQKAI